MDALSPFETRVAVGRLTAMRPHIEALAAIVHRDDLWLLCRDALVGVDLHTDGWDLRCRDAGVVVRATSRGAVERAVVITWREVARLVAAHVVVRRGAAG